MPAKDKIYLTKRGENNPAKYLAKLLGRVLSWVWKQTVIATLIWANMDMGEDSF